VLAQTLPPPSNRPKANKGPRALGLLELPPKGKAHLIPITILIDGKYYDASAYKAAPVPMALWSDTVYEAVRTGVSLGLFTVTGALQAKDPNNAVQWMAEGTWQTASEVKAKAAKKPVPSIPRGMNDDEGPPVLLRRSTEKSKSDSPAPPATTAQAQPAPTPAPPAAAPTATSPTPAASSPPAAMAPPQQAAPDDQPPEDKDRPALKRGKAGAASAEDAQKKAAADTSARAAGHAALTPANAAPASALQSSTQAANQIQLVPAISDSNGPDPLPYTYSMKPEEEEKFRKKMLAIAADEIRVRAAAIGASATNPQTVHSAAQQGKTTAAKPVQPTFEDVQLRVFDLADINEPELVLTANAHMPQARRQGENSQDLQYMITLVVREDVNGDLHKSLANVTDTQHLDVIPRLELIDAVDVDGDGRGELLFRQVSDAGSAFVIYRVIGDRLYPLFQGTPQ